MMDSATLGDLHLSLSHPSCFQFSKAAFQSRAPKSARDPYLNDHIAPVTTCCCTACMGCHLNSLAYAHVYWQQGRRPH